MAGLLFEQFEVGQTFEHALTRTITEADNTMLSLMTMNPQPLHIDAHFDANTEWGPNPCSTVTRFAPGPVS